jgi:hypothetical protein
MRPIAAFVIAIVALQFSTAVTAQNTACGGTIAGAPTWTVKDKWKVPNTPAAKDEDTLVVKFSLVTPYTASTDNAITITFPSKFFIKNAADASDPTVICADGQATAPQASVKIEDAQFVLSLTNDKWTTAEKTCTFRNIQSGAPTVDLLTCGQNGVRIRTTFDLWGPPTTAGALGSAASLASFKLTDKYKVPNTDGAAVGGDKAGNAVEVKFTTAAFDLDTADAITINFPKGFFVKGATVPTAVCSDSDGVLGTQPDVSAVGDDATKLVLKPKAAWTVKEKTCTFAMLGSGAPTADVTDGVSVQTKRNIVSNKIATGGLGSAAAIKSFSVSTKYKVPNTAGAAVGGDKAGNAVEVVFTTAAFDLDAADAITINFPKGFFVKGATVPTAVCSDSDGVLGTQPEVTAVGDDATKLVLKPKAAWTVKEKTCNFAMLGSGAPTADVTDGVSVQTKRNTVSNKIATGGLGSKATITSFSVSTKYKVPNTAGAAVGGDKAGNAVEVKFATAAFDLDTADAITINFPKGFFVKGATVPTAVCSDSDGVLGTQPEVTAVGDDATKLILKTKTAWTVKEKTCNFAMLGSGVKRGNGQVFVSTIRNLDSDKISSGPLGGQVTSASMAVTEKLPNTPTLVTLTLTTATLLPTGGIITVNYPSSFFGSISATFKSVSCSQECKDAALESISFTDGVGKMTVKTTNLQAGTVTIVLDGFTTANLPTVAPCTVVSIETTNDIESAVANAPISNDLGGQVKGVTFSMTPAQRVANVAAVTANAIVTIGFQLQTAYDKAGSNVITINFPDDFFLTSTPTVECTGGSPAPAASVAFGDKSKFVLTTTNAWDATAKVCTFKNVATGPPTAGRTLVSVQSTRDRASVAVASGYMGGQVQGVTFSMTSAQRVPNVAAATANAIVTIGFKLQTAYTAGVSKAITINFPDSFFLTSTPTVECTGGTPAPAATVAYSGTTQYILTTTNAWDASAKVCTFKNVATGPPTDGLGTSLSCNGGVIVLSTLDRASDAVASGSLGGRVQGVTFSMTPAQRIANVVAVTANAIVTIGFQLQTAYAEAGSNLITIVFPPSFFLTSAPSMECTGGSVAPAATVAWVSSGGLTGYVLTTTNAWDASAKVCTFKNVATGAPTADMKESVFVLSTRDRASVAVSSGTLGGVVTAVSMTALASDRVAQGNRQFTVAFTTESDLVKGSKITIFYPTDFLDKSTTPKITMATATGTTAGTPGDNSIVLTTDTATLTAKSTVTITLCGVLPGVGVMSGAVTNGVRVQTSKDRIACTTLAKLENTKKVTDVSFTISAVQRVAGLKSAVVTVTFKTATALTACAANTIVITVPANFFAADPNPPLSSLTAGTVSGYTVAVATGSITLTGTSEVTAGAQGVTISGITLGAATGGKDTGVTVVTKVASVVVDAESDGVPSGDLSGFKVKSVKTNGCGQTCSTATIVFSSVALASADAITIVFPSGTTFSAAPGKFNMLGDVTSGQQVLVTPSRDTNKIILTPTAFNMFPTFDGTDVTIILSGGFQISSSAMLPGRVSMKRDSVDGSATLTNQAMYMATGLGTTTTTQLAITRPFPGVTNTGVTVGFTTTSPISQGDVVRIFFPTGFFIAAPAVTTCADAPTRGYTMKASDGTTSCNTLTPANVGETGEPITVLTVGSTTSFFDVAYTTGGSAAGKQSVVLSGVTLSAAAASSSVAFYVVTTQDTCSAGMIATGAISNSNPGGPSAPGASTGTGVLLSLAVAIMCSLLFWL